MPSDSEPGGIGEVGLPPLATAVANAIAKLTGKRLRTLPFPETVQRRGWTFGANH